MKSFFASSIIALAVARPASAGPAEDADAANAEGKRLHEAGDRERALARFRLAHQLHPEPRFLYNIAYVLDDLGRDAEAADAYAAHIATAADAHAAQVAAAGGEGETVSYARERLAALGAVLGRVVLVGAKGPVTVDGKPVAGDRLHVDPGKHTFVVGDVSRTLDVAAGRETTIDLTAPTAPEAGGPIAAPPIAAPSITVRHWYRDPIGGALVGGGVVALGVGIGFYVASSSIDDAATYPAHDAALDRARTQRSVSQITSTIGGALIVAGVVRYVLHGNRREEITVTATIHARGLALCGSF